MPEPLKYIYRAPSPLTPKESGQLLLAKDADPPEQKGDRTLFIHQPPVPNSGKAPGLLILLDGDEEIKSEDDYQSTPEILEDLYKNKQLLPQITVFIPAPPDFKKRIDEYACNDSFSSFLNNELVPLLRKAPSSGGLGCSDDRKDTTIAGSSFGGLCASYTALSNPETFGNVISQSGAFWWNKDWDKNGKRFDPFEDWGSASKTHEQVTTQHALNMEWLQEPSTELSESINFYLSGGAIEEDKTPSLNGESFPGALTLNKIIENRLISSGHSVQRKEITPNAEAPKIGDHNPISWQNDKLSALVAAQSRMLLNPEENVKEQVINQLKIKMIDNMNNNFAKAAGLGPLTASHVQAAFKEAFKQSLTDCEETINLSDINLTQQDAIEIIAGVSDNLIPPNSELSQIINTVDASTLMTSLNSEISEVMTNKEDITEKSLDDIIPDKTPSKN